VSQHLFLAFPIRVTLLTIPQLFDGDATLTELGRPLAFVLDGKGFFFECNQLRPLRG
jgi:hypothetical protein